MRFTLLALSLVVLPLTAHAQSLKTDGKLSEAVIRNFYTQSETAHKGTLAEYTAFITNHMSEDVQVTMNSIALMEGAPPQTQTLTMDKKKIVEALPDDYKQSQNAKMEQKINAVKIDPTGTTAIVKTTVLITNNMSAPDQPAVKMYVQSQSLCEDTLTLNTQTEPQISKSTCTTKTKISPIK